MSGVCARGQVEERERDGGGGVDCLRRVGSASLAFTLPHRRSHRRLDRSEVMKPQDMRRRSRVPPGSQSFPCARMDLQPDISSASALCGLGGSRLILHLSPHSIQSDHGLQNPILGTFPFPHQGERPESEL